jgi:hypothetical protein
VSAGLDPVLASLYIQVGGGDPVSLAAAGYWWVMDLDAYKQVRAACRAAGALYPEGDDPDDWAPHPEDRLLGLLVDVRDGGGQPHLERR